MNLQVIEDLMRIRNWQTFLWILWSATQIPIFGTGETFIESYISNKYTRAQKSKQSRLKERSNTYVEMKSVLYNAFTLSYDCAY